MIIAGIYSFNDGEKEVARRYPKLLSEVKSAIKAVNAPDHKNKESSEKTKTGQILYSPKELNKAFKQEFEKNRVEI